MAVSKFLKDSNGNPLCNDSVQNVITQKLASEVKDDNGNKLSKIAIQAEIARALKARIVATGKKPDEVEIDFLVYGIDKPQ